MLALQKEALQKAIAQGYTTAAATAAASEAPSPASSGKLQAQVERVRGEMNQCSLQLAHLHEERDKALVELSRLEEVASLVRREQGVNKRTVRQLPTCQM